MLKTPERSMPAHLDSTCDATCNGHCGQNVKRHADTGRWFITIGHAGFNLPANNGRGYVSEASALRAFARCEAR